MQNNEHFWAAFSQSEMTTIAQLKRLFECLEGDREFNTAVCANKITPEMSARLRRIKVFLDPAQFSFLWEIPQETAGYSACLSLGMEDKLLPEIKEKAEKYPLLLLWGRYLQAMRTYRCSCEAIQPDISQNPRLNAWRKRRMASAKSELGYYGMVISHPVWAFEVSEGCSVGCWFCSFATNKLKGVLDYSTQRDFFCDIVERCIALFGREAAGWALPYYRSEPHDNPDYLKYLQEFARLNGAVLCTSTAAGSDLTWARSLVDYYGNKALPWPRFSVLSTEMMEKIHEAFTPLELRDNQLLMQMREHPRQKVTGGRLFKDNGGLRAYGENENIRQITVPQGSIACASGFLVNLVNRTVELFSPCYASEKWPLGYRVFDRASFTDEADFTRIVTQIIRRKMFFTPAPANPLRFRDDLLYRETAGGFDLISPNQVHHFTPAQYCGSLGALIAAGKNTYHEISEELSTVPNINPLVVSIIIQRLFEEGFLDEVYGS